MIAGSALSRIRLHFITREVIQSQELDHVDCRRNSQYSVTSHFGSVSRSTFASPG